MVRYSAVMNIALSDESGCAMKHGTISSFITVCFNGWIKIACENMFASYVITTVGFTCCQMCRYKTKHISEIVKN